MTHSRLYEHYRPLVRAGLCDCPYCGERIEGPFHLGHSDDRTHWIGPTCPKCNLREAGLKSQRLRRGQRTVTSQEW